MLNLNVFAAFRTLRRKPVFTLLNGAGLAIGMTCCLLIGLYVQHELSYDDHQPYADRTYRVVQKDVEDGGGNSFLGDGALPILRSSVPAVEQVVRVADEARDVTVLRESGTNEKFSEDHFAFADAGAFKIFDWTIVQGERENLLAAPDVAILSESAAERYFGGAGAIGQTLRISQNGNDVDLTVQAIMADPTEPSHLEVDVLASFGANAALWGQPPSAVFSSFWFPSSNMYVLLDEGADVAKAETTIRELVDENRDPGDAAELDATLQPITDIHLHSDLLGESAGGNPQQVYLFIAIALFVLGIASVNFVNLATAQGVERAREIGVRLSLGAQRGQVVRQHLLESLLVSATAGLGALALTVALFPAFESLLGTELYGSVYESPWLWGGTVVVVLLTGLGAGSYPAFVLTSVEPSTVLRKQATGMGKGAGLRRGLVVLQFAISAALIVATTIAFQQLDYVQSADLGFDEEEILSVQVAGSYPLMKQEMEANGAIRTVVGANSSPGLGITRRHEYEINGEAPSNEGDNIATKIVDFGFFEMLDVDLVAGRVFSEERPADMGRTLPRDETHFGWYYRDKAAVVNEATLQKFDWTAEEAIGKTIRLTTAEQNTYYFDLSATVVGVVKDYHAGALRAPIEPMMFVPAQSPRPAEQDGFVHIALQNMLVKVNPGQTPGEAMQAVKRVFNEVAPGEIFEASFLDARIAAQYENEQRTGWMVGTFAGLALFVACLGLFGLAAFAAQQRMKEIGIRKALGATVPSIVRMISSEYVVLVAIAIAVAAPLAYVGMSRWLEDFAYRIDLGVLPLIIALGVVLTVALGTVSSQALRAARVDPARVLGDE
jgi:putative ABC transport system permease protein